MLPLAKKWVETKDGGHDYGSISDSVVFPAANNGSITTTAPSGGDGDGGSVGSLSVDESLAESTTNPTTTTAPIVVKPLPPPKPSTGNLPICHIGPQRLCTRGARVGKCSCSVVVV